MESSLKAMRGRISSFAASISEIVSGGILPVERIQA
jgi:hypothetical protein